jgi:hypothetical protein
MLTCLQGCAIDNEVLEPCCIYANISLKCVYVPTYAVLSAFDKHVLEPGCIHEKISCACTFQHMHARFEYVVYRGFSNMAIMTFSHS